jgi:hypothetical protein
MMQMDISVHQQIAITAGIDERLAEQLKAIARDHDRSLAAEVRRAVTEHAHDGRRPAETGARDA